MNKEIILWVVIAVLAVSVLYVTFFKGFGTGQAIQTSDGKIDTTGWTENEIMNYEMHGVIPSRISGSSSSGSGMVGGC